MSLLDRLRRKREDAHSSPPEDHGTEGDGFTEHTEGEIEDERRDASVQKPPSIQSRMSNFLALSLFSALGVGLLVWYFSNAVATRTQGQRAVKAAADSQAKGDVALKPLGRVDPPAQTDMGLESVLGEAPPEPPADIPPAWLTPAEDAPQPAYARAPTPAKTPDDLRRERLLNGAGFAASSTALTFSNEQSDDVEERAPANLDSLLKPSATKAVRAQVLPTQRLLLPKGAFLDCTLETAIDSTLPGMTTCILATDAFSADGTVVLLERGTKLVGETRGEARQGSARLFVLWSEARTPAGVIVPLASPGADQLGRSGLSGTVNRHFWERFGSAILLSVIDGAIQTAVASQQSGGGTVVVSPSGSSDIVTEVLKSTVNIPPTIVKPQGDRIQVLVARDLDFRSVYSLRPVAEGR